MHNDILSGVLTKPIGSWAPVWPSLCR